MPAQPAQELTFICDENLGGMAAILQRARARPAGRILSMEEAGFAEALDVEWMTELGRRQDHVVVTRDSDILNVTAQSAAWRGSGLRLFLLARGWGQLPAADLVRGLMYWWPAIVSWAHLSAPGTAWLVSSRVPEPPPGGIRPVTGSAPPA